MHVTIIPSNHLKVKSSSRVPVEVGNEPLANLGAAVSKVGELHDGVLSDELGHDGLDALVVLVASDDGTLGVVIVVDEFEADGGEVPVCFVGGE